MNDMRAVLVVKTRHACGADRAGHSLVFTNRHSVNVHILSCSLAACCIVVDSLGGGAWRRLHVLMLQHQVICRSKAHLRFQEIVAKDFVQRITILGLFGSCLSVDWVKLADDGRSDGGLADDRRLAWCGTCLFRAHDMRVVIVTANFNTVAGHWRRHLILVYSPKDVFHRSRLHMVKNSSLSYCLAAHGRGRHLIVDE